MIFICAKLINSHILSGYSKGMHIEHIQHFIEIHIPLNGQADISWGGTFEFLHFIKYSKKLMDVRSASKQFSSSVLNGLHGGRSEPHDL